VNFSESHRRAFRFWIFGFAALALGVQLFVAFLAGPRTRWVGLLHDRNGHYAYGLKMAVALEAGDLPQFIGELEKGKTWPPLHGLLVAITQLTTGNDWRLAVLPSLAGWVLMLTVAALTAAKITDARGSPWGAAVVAFILCALSPAHRIFATDVMLESLGAGLSVAVLGCYAVAAEQRQSRVWWRVTALALTLLFFEKYNYWLLIALALGGVEGWMHRSALRACFFGIAWRWRLRTELRQPLNWLLLALLVCIATLLAHGPASFIVFGRVVPIQRPNNLITIAYAVLFLRVALVLRAENWAPRSVAACMLWRWHLLPVAISFLFPQRLSAFAGFLSPTNYGDAPSRDVPGAAAFYADALTQDYHVSSWFLIAAILLSLCALVRWSRLNPGSRAAFLCLALAATLTLIHPNQKSRFLHSWIPVLWVTAGAGAGMLGRTAAARVLLGLGVAVAAFAGGKSWAPAGHSPETGHRGETKSLLDISDVWLADSAGPARIAFVATQPMRPFIEWTFLQRYGQRERLELPRFQSEKSNESIRAGFEQWLPQSSAQKLIFIEIQPSSPEFVAMFDHPEFRTHFAGWMAGQPRWSKRTVRTFPAEGWVVTTWDTK
jgi:hypothetical protein